MHPIVADQIASDRVRTRLEVASLRRAVRATRPVGLSWRARQARHRVALAPRLDPTLDRRVAPRTAAVR